MLHSSFGDRGLGVAALGVCGRRSQASRAAASAVTSWAQAILSPYNPCMILGYYRSLNNYQRNLAEPLTLLRPEPAHTCQCQRPAAWNLVPFRRGGSRGLYNRGSRPGDPLPTSCLRSRSRPSCDLQKRPWNSMGCSRVCRRIAPARHGRVGRGRTTSSSYRLLPIRHSSWTRSGGPQAFWPPGRLPRAWNLPTRPTKPRPCFQQAARWIPEPPMTAGNGLRFMGMESG